MLARWVALALTGLLCASCAHGMSGAQQVSRSRAAYAGETLVYLRTDPGTSLGVTPTQVVAATPGGRWIGALTPPPADVSQPSFSANGQVMAFVREALVRARGRWIYRYDGAVDVRAADGAVHRVLSCSDPCQITDLTVSPDGTRLAFSENGSIEVVSAAGGRPRVVCTQRRCGQGLGAIAWSPDGRALAFTNQDMFFIGFGFAQSALYVAQLDGGVRAIVGRCPHRSPACQVDDSPVWSPDGRWIAFIRQNRSSTGGDRTVQSGPAVMLVRPDGSGLHQLIACTDELCPQQGPISWAPDGSRLAVAGDIVDRASHVIEIASLTGGVKVLTTCRRGMCITPADVAWSPSGDLLAFTGDAPPSADWTYTIRTDGQGMARAGAGNSWIGWLPGGAVTPTAVAPRPPKAPRPAATPTGVIDVVGSLKPHVHYLGEVLEAAARGGHLHVLVRLPRGIADAWEENHLTIAPDGRAVALAACCLDGNEEIFTARIGPSAGLHPLTALPNAVWPAWAPDGGRIAFEGRIGAYHQIWVMNANGTGQHAVSPPRESALTPAWSPDGHRIAFVVTGRDATSEIDAASPNGNGEQTLLRLPGWISDPAWSPDGRWIAFAWDPLAGGEEIYALRLSDGVLREVTDVGGQPGPSEPAWSPDGRWIAFEAVSSTGRAIYVTPFAAGEPVRVTPARGGSFDSPVWRP